MPYPQRGETDQSRIVFSLREIWEGRSNAGGQFTCALNAATTVVTAPNCGTSSRIFLTARHANAAAEIGNGTIYVSSVAQGTFTVTHANSAVASRIFDYEIKG